MDVRQFKPTLYLLVFLGFCGFSLASESPGLWLFSSLLLGLNAWLVWTGRFVPLPRMAANAITLLTFAYVVLRVPSADPSELVFAIAQFLVLLQLVKFFEQRANRDYAQLIVLSLLLMVAASISSTSLFFAMLLVSYLLLSLYSCLLFHLKVEADRARAVVPLRSQDQSAAALRYDQRFLARSMRRLTAVIATTGVIVAVVVFLFFPRGAGAGVLGPLQFKTRRVMTGFSERVSFQQVARITQSEDIVAHVKVWRNEEAVTGGPLLLRGLTLDTYAGHGDRASYTWTRSQAMNWDLDVPAGSWQELAPPAGAEVWRQEMTLRPTGTNVLFALPGVTSVRPERQLRLEYTSRDEVIRSLDKLTQPIKYEVRSRGWAQSSPRPREVYTAMRDAMAGRTDVSRPNMPPRILEYATRPDVSGADDRGALAARRPAAAFVSDLDEAIANNIARHLQKTFIYTLDLTDAEKIIRGQDPIVAFLYDLKRGHCEYFAGAMTLMCQSLGMQARMVIGFKCDEFNPIAGHYVVRQSHAHAWVEVRLPDGKWKTYDPTSGNDPREAANDEAGYLSAAWRPFKNVFDFLEFQWAEKVIAFDQSDRENVVTRADTNLTSTIIKSSLWVSNLGQVVEAAGYWMASRVVGPVIGVLVLAIVAAISRFAYERWRMRRRAERIGLDALPTRDQLRLARQLAFYDQLVRSLERRGIARPRHLTPQEFGESLSFLPTESFDAIRRLTTLFYRVRYGNDRIGPEMQQRLQRVVARLNLGMEPAR